MPIVLNISKLQLQNVDKKFDKCLSNTKAVLAYYVATISVLMCLIFTTGMRVAKTLAYLPVALQGHGRRSKQKPTNVSCFAQTVIERFTQATSSLLG